MLAAFFLTAFPTFITLILSWLLGVGVIASLFVVNRRRIRSHEEGM